MMLYLCSSFSVVFCCFAVVFYRFGCFLATGGPPETAMASGSPRTLKGKFRQGLLEVISGSIWAPGGIQVFIDFFDVFVDGSFGRHFADFVPQRGTKACPR